MSTINYIGSKLSLIDWLLEAFDIENIKTFAEPMCGTGIVSETVAKTACRLSSCESPKSGIKVYANDICSYASILTASRVVPFNQSLYDVYFKKFTEISECGELGILGDANGFVYANYAETGSERLYFASENAKKLDACRTLLDTVADLDTNTKNALIATIIIAADKVANTASVYVSFLKQLKKSAQQPIAFKRIISMCCDSASICSVSNKDAILFLRTLPEKVDLIYVGYCSYYHVLETIALNDNPTVRGITGLRHDCLEKNSDTSKKSNLPSILPAVDTTRFPEGQSSSLFILLRWNGFDCGTGEHYERIWSRYYEGDGLQEVHDEEW